LDSASPELAGEAVHSVIKTKMITSPILTRRCDDAIMFAFTSAAE